MINARPFSISKFQDLSNDTNECEVFRALLSSSEHLRILKGSKSPTLQVLGFTPTLGQSGVATIYQINQRLSVALQRGVGEQLIAYECAG
jgi:hypothetical protein